MAREITGNLTTLEGIETSNDLELLLAENALHLVYLAVHHRTWIIRVLGATHLEGRDRETSAPAPLAGIDHKPVTLSDMIVSRHRFTMGPPIARTPAITAARIRQISAGHVQKTMCTPTNAVYRHHPRLADVTATVIPVEIASTIVIVPRESEAGNEVAATMEVVKKEAVPGPHRHTAIPAPNRLVPTLGRKRLRLQLQTVMLTLICQILSTSCWV